MQLDRFYLIVGNAERVERLVPLGVKLVQLRIKDATPADIRAQVVHAKAVCDRHGCQLIVNDYWKTAIETGCDFVHLGQEDLVDADLPALRRAGIRYGVSTHDGAELDLALARAPAYVALGPIYPTLLKKMRWAPQGLNRLTTWKARIGEVPLVAIGGLSIDRLPGVFAAGADSAAVVTDIQQAKNPEAQTRAWIEATRGELA